MSRLPRPTAERPGQGAGTFFIGCALAAFAAYLGDVRATVPLLLALIVLCTLAGLWRPTRLLMQWGSGLLAAVVALCLLTPVLRGPLDALTFSQTPQKADAIVVLGGGVQCGSGQLESSSVARLLGGLKLWRKGYAPILTVSEQSGLLWEKTCPKMSTLEQQLVQQLYPAGGPQILTLHNVMTTRDEANRVSVYARQRGWKRVIIVTTPSHSRRTAALFARYGVPAMSVPTVETRFDTSLPKPSDRLFALRTLLYEWLSRVKMALGGTPEHSEP